MRRDLHEIAIRIYQLCLENRIEFEIDWIAQTEIPKADFLSRLIDIDDWQISRLAITLENLSRIPICRIVSRNTTLPKY